MNWDNLQAGGFKDFDQMSTECRRFILFSILVEEKMKVWRMVVPNYEICDKRNTKEEYSSWA